MQLWYGYAVGPWKQCSVIWLCCWTLNAVLCNMVMLLDPECSCGMVVLFDTECSCGNGMVMLLDTECSCGMVILLDPECSCGNGMVMLLDTECSCGMVMLLDPNTAVVWLCCQKTQNWALVWLCCQTQIQTHQRFKRTLIYYDIDTQPANFQGSPLRQATKWHLLNNS